MDDSLKVIPVHLQSTFAMIKKAFPDQITEREYQSLIALLYLHMSDRNLIDVLCLSFEKEVAEAYQHIAKYHNHIPGDDVKQQLIKAGWHEWLQKE